MFADVIERLKVEALKTIPTNAELLAGWQESSVNKNKVLEYIPDNIHKIGISTFLAGMFGIAASVEAYHAVFFGSAVAVEKMIVELGLVVAGEAVVPVTGLIAFGAAVVGATAVAIGVVADSLSKKVPFGDEDLLKNKALVDKDGRSVSIGPANWAVGAGKLVAELIQGRMALKMVLEDKNLMDASEQFKAVEPCTFSLYDPRYDAQYLFKTALDAVTKANALGCSRFQKILPDGHVLQVNKTDGEWLYEDGSTVRVAENNTNFIAAGWFNGRIEEIEDGVVVQCIRRNPDILMRHSAANLSRIPEKGEVVDIKYSKDFGMVSEKNLGVEGVIQR